jgi:hypothetical protein
VSLTTRQVGFALLGLTVITIGLTVLMAVQAHHGMAPIHYAPAAALVAMMVVWPFANGWRPWTDSLPQSCRSCGTQWLPGESQGHCPACGQVSAA